MATYWTIERKQPRKLVRKFKKFGEAKTKWRSLPDETKNEHELVRVERYPGVPSTRHIVTIEEKAE